MNKQKFIEFVENPASIREKDSDILAELARNYPYASLVHTMLAKAHRNNEQAHSSLANAALYIPDRSVLKSIMEDELTPATPQVQSSPEPVKAESVPSGSQVELVQTESIRTESIQAEEENPSSHVVGQNPEGFNPDNEEIMQEAVPEQEMAEKRDVFAELQENLQRLKEQREWLEKPSESKATLGETTLVELQEQDSLPSAHSEAEPAVKAYRLPERLQEIVESTEEKTIDDPKRKEQINLIDNFIKNSASISRKYRSIEAPENQPDLTGNNHFTPPDLVTENLAQIMVRQGKTEKAIDIYEKLVLKYPQKKAYFASCIEKLKTPD